MVAIIVAMTPGRVIGQGKKLPWNITSDLRRFKKLTVGHPVIMGWNTFAGICESLGHPLEGRENIVLTHNHDTEVRKLGALPCHSPEAALVAAAQSDKEPFVIGGAQVYERMLPLAQTLHITTVHADISGDVLFPLIPDMDRWEVKEGLEKGRHHMADQYQTSYYRYAL